MKTSELETPKILNDFTKKWNLGANMFYLNQFIDLTNKLHYTTKIVFDLYEKSNYSSLILKAYEVDPSKRNALVNSFISRKQNHFVNGLKRLVQYHLGSELDWSELRLSESGILNGIVRNDIKCCVLVETFKIGGDESVNFDYRYKVTSVPYDFKSDCLYNKKI